MQDSYQKINNVDYSWLSVDDEIKLDVQEKTIAIKLLVRRSAEDIITIGKLLTEVKAEIGHGNFREWLKREFKWSISAAAKFMQTYQQFKSVNFTHLQFSPSALYVLSSPSTNEAARKEALSLASQGQIVTYSLAQRLRNKHKDANRENLSTQENTNTTDNENLTTNPDKEIKFQNLLELCSWLNPDWEIARRGNSPISLIFIFLNSQIIHSDNNLKQDILHHQEKIKSCLQRSSDYLLSIDNSQMVNIIRAPSVNHQGAINLVNKIIKLCSLETINFFQFGIVSLIPNSELDVEYMMQIIELAQPALDQIYSSVLL